MRETVKLPTGENIISWRARGMDPIDVESATAAKTKKGVFLNPSEKKLKDWRGRAGAGGPGYNDGPMLLAHGTGVQEGLSIGVDGHFLSSREGYIT